MFTLTENEMGIMPHVAYHFTTVSPWSYLGHALFLDITHRHGATVSVHPTPFGSVFAESGGLPLPKRHPLRQRYRLSELQRWRARRDVPLTLHPRFFPADATLADCTALAAVREGLDALPFVGAAMRACWAEERDIADPDTVEELAGANGLPLTLSREARARLEEEYRAGAAEALAKGVFGAPSFVLNGEVFWGQDRLELLDDALGSGRGPMLPD